MVILLKYKISVQKCMNQVNFKAQIVIRSDKKIWLNISPNIFKAAIDSFMLIPTVGYVSYEVLVKVMFPSVFFVLSIF